ncbi:MAG: HAMP domain-containing histidine kinase [Anaerolineae bacterium]|nr:HAMP domain-containing histidine kinase [Anaerolineae bacterium]
MEMSDQRLAPVRQNLRPVVTSVEARLAEVKSRFFSAAAHELRTPLTTIVGYLEMLLDGEFGPLSESQREHLKVVSESARHLRAVTNNLLAVAQIEAGRIPLDLQRIDLAALVQTVADGIQPRLRLKAQRLELRTASDLPLALCDFGKAMQVADTLLDGAYKRTPEGGVIAASVSRAAEKGFLQLTVMDGGPPMSAQEMAQMAKYLSLDGMGLIEADVADLDLYVACSLVELHGGRFWCESAPERGSSFSVTFPIADEPR